MSDPVRHPAPRAALVLVGPTASGKTAAAHAIARARGWAVLSADAMQVYRGLDIGTAKPTAAERAGLIYGGLDYCDPDRAFSAGEYARAAAAEWPRLSAAPAVLAAGGSGLYVKALVEGLDAAPSEPELRAEAEALMARGGLAALQAAVRERAPDLWAALRDPANPRRLVRAYERARLGDRPRPAGPPPPRPRLIGLRVAPAELAERIRARVRAMYAAGLPDEAAALRARWPRLSPAAAQAIGYREAWDLLDGRCSPADAIERTALRTRQYAKRQMTWWRRQADVVWVEAGGGRSLADIAAEICEHAERHGGIALHGLG